MSVMTHGGSKGVVLGIGPVGVGKMAKFQPDWKLSVSLAVGHGVVGFLLSRLLGLFNLFGDITWRASALFGIALTAVLFVFYTGHDVWDWGMERRRSRSE
nr:hypothetical protein OG781_42865 [Streptomyces sp. NBC_00830]